MAELKVIDVGKSIFDAADKVAEEVRTQLKNQKTYMINLMASPGAGKTTFLLATIAALKAQYKIGVMEADIEASVDAQKMEQAGVRCIQVHTGGECAMTSNMTKAALNEFQTDDLDLLFLENIGNLVCPAEEDVGAISRVALLSVPEGDDKPLKYPLMFEVCDVIVITKIDTKAYFPFDDEAVRTRIHKRNPRARIFFVSAKTGEGMKEWIAYLTNEVDHFIK